VSLKDHTNGLFNPGRVNSEPLRCTLLNLILETRTFIYLYDLKGTPLFNRGVVSNTYLTKETLKRVSILFLEDPFHTRFHVGFITNMRAISESIFCFIYFILLYHDPFILVSANLDVSRRRTTIVQVKGVIFILVFVCDSFIL
jgi:hypothetical protein